MKIFKFILIIALVLLNNTALAEKLSSDDPVTHLEQYLNNLSTMVAEFDQINSDGQTANGTFYLKRPGKIRWQYNPPVPVVLIINEKNATYYDYELDEITHTKLEDELVGFLTKKNIRFSEDVMITNIETEADITRITLTHSNDSMNGSLILEFLNDPLKLIGIETLDENHNKVMINFKNVVLNTKIKDELFHHNNLKNNKRY